MVSAVTTWAPSYKARLLVAFNSPFRFTAPTILRCAGPGSLVTTMASRLFFDPLVIVRVAPLITATCTLVFGNVQHFFLSTLNLPENKKPSRALPPSYWDGFFRRGVKTAVALLLVTIGSSIANIYIEPASLKARESYAMYVTGAVLSVAHFIFAPIILPSGMSLTTNETQSGVNLFDILDRWLWAQTIQMWTVDLGAWLALLVAVGRTLQA